MKSKSSLALKGWAMSELSTHIRPRKLHKLLPTMLHIAVPCRT